jgi:hypothetical protein
MKQISNKNSLGDADVGEDSEQEGFYYVEQVLDKRIIKGKIWYKVKWKDWPIKSATWQCVEELDSCRDLIDKFEEDRKNGSTSTNKKHVETAIESKKKNKENEIEQEKTVIEDISDEKDEKEVLTETINYKALEEEGKSIEGNLYDDEPTGIIAAKKSGSGSDILLLIKWKPRKNGVTPENTKILSSTFRKSHPRMLIDYYESKVC